LGEEGRHFLRDAWRKERERDAGEDEVRR